MLQAEPPHPSQRQQASGKIAALGALQARLHVAAQQRDAQIGPMMQQLRLAPHGRGANHPVDRQTRKRIGRVERPAAMPKNQRIARVLALQRARQNDARRQAGFQIFQTVHGEIDAAIEHGLVDFLGEQPLAADVR